jgi:hypothetical protein
LGCLLATVDAEGVLVRVEADLAFHLEEVLTMPDPAA